jgi:hypothetical protein
VAVLVLAALDAGRRGEREDARPGTAHAGGRRLPGAEVAPTTPPQVSYRLSPLGADLTVRLSGLLGFIITRIPDIQAARRAW